MTKFLYVLGVVFLVGAMFEQSTSAVTDTVEYLRLSVAGMFAYLQTGAVPSVLHGFAVAAQDWATNKVEK